VSTLINNTELREIALGRYVQGKTSTITADTTHQVFTITGGEVLITALWGKVTTSITDDGEGFALQLDPTTGDTDTWVTATDLGTTDTLAGDIIGVAIETNDTANNQVNFAVNQQPLMNYIATTGEIELVVDAGTGSEDGVVEWYCTYVPLTAGASVAASA